MNFHVILFTVTMLALSMVSILVYTAAEVNNFLNELKLG